MAGKTLGIMQPYFFPYIGYFQTINAVDKYILYSNLDYIKDGWIHKNRILGTNIGPFYIIASVVHKSSFTKIREMRLDTSRKWRKKVLHSIYFNYRRRPFFEEIYPVIERVINYETDYLYVLNEVGIKTICRYLGFSTEISCDNDKYDDLERRLLKVDSNDYSEFPYLGKNRPIRKVLRAIEMCREERATTFINAIGGQALYDKSEFASYGIELKFMNTGYITYPQPTNEFYPNLSILDVLMNCGKDKTRLLLHQYTLV